MSTHDELSAMLREGVHLARTLLKDGGDTVDNSAALALWCVAAQRHVDALSDAPRDRIMDLAALAVKLAAAPPLEIGRDWKLCFVPRNLIDTTRRAADAAGIDWRTAHVAIGSERWEPHAVPDAPAKAGGSVQ